MPRSIVYALLLVAFSGCNCGQTRLADTDPCLTDPAACDGGAIVPPTSCEVGAISGQVCAPDQQTWVNGAAVSVSGTDCNGQPFDIQTISQANGAFSLGNVPAGSWTVHAALGSFSQDTPVTVSAGQTTAIPENQLCVAQKQVQIAVITGSGDKIENLLGSLQLQYTTYRGDGSHYGSDAAVFLSNLQEMEKFDLIFIDCGAGESSGSDDLGSNRSAIEQNLHDYVLNGGSLYASDWALLFAVYAQPGDFDFETRTGNPIGDPLATHDLMGYAPQTVTANITDPGLATFLNKDAVSISFPTGSGVASLHWGLMQSVDPAATVLVSAPSVKVCDGSTSCGSSGGTATNIPLAARIKLTPVGTRGGNIVYTSFHNIAQSGNDVAQILKYLVLNL